MAEGVVRFEWWSGCVFQWCHAGCTDQGLCFVFSLLTVIGKVCLAY